MGSHCDEPQSLECIKRSDMYPRANLTYDDPAIQHIPFPLLCGEDGLFLGRSAEGVVTLTNFRLHICQRKSFLNIPLRLIEKVESRDLFYLVIECKDATTVRCKFSCNEDCQLWLKRITDNTQPPTELTKLFAFAFYSHGSEQEEILQLSVQASMSACDQAAQLCTPLEEKYMFSFGKEVERMQFDLSRKKIWRILQTNEDYSLCESYPRHHILPASFTDEQIKNVASFRSGRRFPSVVWRDQRNGAVIARSSQPEYGLFGWRNADDELLFKCMQQACVEDVGMNTYHSAQPDNVEQTGEEGPEGIKVNAVTAEKKMLVIDCRSYSAAFANRAKGGGSECSDYYTNCEVLFMNMANIHTIRKSYQSLRTVCSNFPDHNWLSSLEGTKWMNHLAAILCSTQMVVSAVEDARPVLIHCSDGWDRTAQISSLAQLLLDPYYRTIQGFQWLVEREWLEFGHKFADRCGHRVGEQNTNEHSPVFVQWLDCVYQITRQFPCHFQFNEAFLIKLVQHTYSCLFGTFLFNTSQERKKEAVTNPTSSVWTLLHPDNPKFHNPLYNPNATEVLMPDWSLHCLKLWSSVYLSNISLKTSSAEEFAASVEQANQVLTPDEEPAGLTKTRSCDNLTTLAITAQEGSSTLTRRSSDPNIGCGGDTMALLSKEVDGSQRANLDESSSGDSSDSDVAAAPSSSEEEVCREESELERYKLEEEVVVEGAALETVNEQSAEDNNSGDDCPPSAAIDSIADQDEQAVPQPMAVTEIVSQILGDAAGQDEQAVPQPMKVTEIVSQVLGDGEFQSPDSASLERCADAGISCDSEEKAVVMNGHSVNCTTFVEADTQTSESGLLNGDHHTSLNGGNDDRISTTSELTLDTKAFESSTDTLTGSEDQALLLKSQQRFMSHTVSCQNGDAHNGYFDSDNEEEHLLKGRQDLDSASMESLKLMIQKNCSISTSTTDISDSHVTSHGNGVASEVMSRAAGLGLFIRCNNSMCGMGGVGRRTPSSSEASPSVCSLVATPINSQTPPSTCSPTPGSEGKNSESPLVRQLNSVARHLDCDGLTTFVDPALERVQYMMRDYQRRIIALEYRLAAATAHINQMMPLSNGAGRVVDSSDYVNSPIDMGEGGELSSLGTESNPASDVSWEQVDERESRITLWVPDHVVTHCAGCGNSFWIGRRKHHCRNCGKVYCYTCSNFFAPVPTQQLAEPVRLCSSCYNQLHLNGPGAASDDTRISVGAE